jgi:hypothetical protein
MALVPNLEARPGHDAPWRWSLHDWIGGGTSGLVVLALAVGLGAGPLGNPHLAWMGRWFVVVAPVVGGLLTGRSSGGGRRRHEGTEFPRSCGWSPRRAAESGPGSPS